MPRFERRRTVLFGALAALTLVGLVDAWKLVGVHQAANLDAAADSFCNLSAAVSCDVVARSSWSVLMGLPVAVWGVFWYGLFSAGLVWAVWSRRLTGVLFVASSFSEVFSLTLAFISLFVIESLCILCAVSWVVNLASNVLLWKLVKGRGRGSARGLIEALVGDVRYLWRHRYSTAAIALSAIGVLVELWAFYPRYWVA